MPLEVSVRLRCLHQDERVKICERVKRCPNYSKSNVYIHTKLPDEVAKVDGRKLNNRRPGILTTKDEPKIIRTLLMLREILGSFGITQKLESGVDAHVSDNTIIRILKRNNHYCLQTRKKGLII